MHIFQWFYLFYFVFYFPSTCVAMPINRPLRVDFTDVQRAQQNLSRHLKPTPLHRSVELSKKYDCTLFLKLEMRQPIKAFKIRGAWNFFSQVVQPKQQEGVQIAVVTASSGNHAQGVAYCARHFGVSAKIFMSQNTPALKVKKTKDLGAEVVLYGKTYDEAYEAAQQDAVNLGQLYVHPYMDEHVIAGQGTIALEIFEQLKEAEQPEPDLILCPVGGGGLSAGIGVVIQGLNSKAQLVGIQPEAVGSMARSYQNKRAVDLSFSASPTQADGVAVLKTSPEMFELLQYLKVSDMKMVSEESIQQARDELECLGFQVEGAGALALALLYEPEFQEQLRGKTVVLILSGGNFDPMRNVENGSSRLGEQRELSESKVE